MLTPPTVSGVFSMFLQGLVGAMLTFAAIIAGSAATMKYEYWRMMREA